MLAAPMADDMTSASRCKQPERLYVTLYLGVYGGHESTVTVQRGFLEPRPLVPHDEVGKDGGESKHRHDAAGDEEQ